MYIIYSKFKGVVGSDLILFQVGGVCIRMVIHTIEAVADVNQLFVKCSEGFEYLAGCSKI